jgi:hypothetical protein
MKVLDDIGETAEMLRSASVCESGCWSSSTARGMATTACGMRSIGVLVPVADTEVSARYPLTGPAVVCVTGGPPLRTTPSGSAGALLRALEGDAAIGATAGVGLGLATRTFLRLL